MTLKGKGSSLTHKIDAALIGVKRLINSNFYDSFKQECLNLILGKHFISQDSTIL